MCKRNSPDKKERNKIKNKIKKHQYGMCQGNAPDKNKTKTKIKKSAWDV